MSQKKITILSSQRYLDRETVEKKKSELIDDEEQEVTIPCSYVGFIVVDKHHTLEAAKELGLEIVFDINDDIESRAAVELAALRAELAKLEWRSACRLF